MGIETLAAISLGTTVLGTGVSAMGASATADANAKSAQYQAAVARNNQIIAGQYADRSIMTGLSRSEMMDYRTRGLLGTAKATQAASGVDVNSGSPAAVRASIGELGSLDAATLRYNAEQEAYGYKVKGAGFAAESQLDTMKAENARTAGDYAVASSILSGASSVSSKWLSFQQKGIY